MPVVEIMLRLLSYAILAGMVGVWVCFGWVMYRMLADGAFCRTKLAKRALVFGIVFVFAGVNFFVGIAGVMEFGIGGTPSRGKVVNGHYYFGSGGEYTEVSELAYRVGWWYEKITLLLLALAAAAFFLTLLMRDRQDERAWQAERDQIVQRVIEDLLAGEYEAASERFTPEMAAALPREKLAAAIDPLRAEHGNFKNVIEYRAIPTAAMSETHISVMEVELVDGHSVRFTVTLDSQQRISNLTME